MQSQGQGQSTLLGSSTRDPKSPVAYWKDFGVSVVGRTVTADVEIIIWRGKTSFSVRLESNCVIIQQNETYFCRETRNNI